MRKICILYRSYLHNYLITIIFICILQLFNLLFYKVLPEFNIFIYCKRLRRKHSKITKNSLFFSECYFLNIELFSFFDAQQKFIIAHTLNMYIIYLRLKNRKLHKKRLTIRLCRNYKNKVPSVVESCVKFSKPVLCNYRRIR